MCKALEEWSEDEKKKGWKEGWESGWESGWKKGWKRGLKRGRREERISIIKNLIREKAEEKYIRNVTGCSDKEFSLAQEGGTENELVCGSAGINGGL